LRAFYEFFGKHPNRSALPYELPQFRVADHVGGNNDGRTPGRDDCSRQGRADSRREPVISASMSKIDPPAQPMQGQQRDGFPKLPE
jgi:hypothetical protein